MSNGNGPLTDRQRAGGLYHRHLPSTLHSSHKPARWRLAAAVPAPCAAAAARDHKSRRKRAPGGCTRHKQQPRPKTIAMRAQACRTGTSLTRSPPHPSERTYPHAR
jgi:hypothetical protein